MIAGVTVEIGREAVLVVAAQRLRVLSSAVHLGWAAARTVRAALDRGVREWQERSR
ncbi:MAG TPA: hypothetical protein VFT36_09895 [Methylomirabilota bacterium]|nr:hypothetical protein [Methylomirabilota bacterium]